MTYFNYYISVIIWQILNPFGFYQSLLQNFGQTISVFRLLIWKGSIDYTPMSLPFDGQWKVFNGGTDKLNSHSWNVISQRYAYDFVISENGNKRFITDGKKAIDYLAFNKDVVAPNDGIVVAVKNNIKDYRSAGSGKIDIWTTDIRGNFIIIKHDENIYSLSAHLKKNSCLVKKGDIVKRGQNIAKCGNSGHSTEPHIHFQLQDNANWYFSNGLPIMFANIVKNNIDINCNKTIDPIYISKKDIVSNSNTNKHSSNKMKVEVNWYDDLLNPFIWGIINTLGIIVGGGFIYYTIVQLIIRIGKLLID
jgi:murein DD-endopeptidase MepM/ murein hydrolase activator NlpD